MKYRNRFKPKGPFSMWEKTTHSRTRFRSARSIEPPWNPLSAQLRELLQVCHKTIYQVSAVTAIDGAYIWRIVRGERIEISREILILIGLALILEKSQFDKVVEILNWLLDKGGYRMLRPQNEEQEKILLQGGSNER